MKFGANTFIWSEAFGPEHFGILPRLKEAGFDGIEIAMLSPATVPAAAIRRELDKFGFECTCCSAFGPGLNLASEDSATRQKAMTHVRDSLKAAADLGASLVAGPMYTPVGYFTGTRRTEDEWNRVLECWQELRADVKQSGVKVAIEPLNRFETYFLNIASDAAKFCDELGDPNIGILLDTFHCNIEEKSIGPALKAAGRHLMHIHSCENDRGIPGSGHVDWPEFFQTLAEISYDGWLTIESFGFSLGALSAAAAIWRDLAPSPESIAVEGIQFLRKNINATMGQSRANTIQ
jgi:D-psicose/D-tagatose/L-ribulose 3-epimerase